MIGHGPAFIHSSKCITHSNRLGRALLVTTSVGFSGERAAVAEVVVEHVLYFSPWSGCISEIREFVIFRELVGKGGS